MSKRIYEAIPWKSRLRGDGPHQVARFSRRVALVGTAAWPLAADAEKGTRIPGAPSRDPSGGAVADLVKRTEQAGAALMRGDINAYLALIRHADDYTLMRPFGGLAKRGFDGRPESLAALANFFKGGEVTLEVAQSYASGDLVVLVLIERQHGAVGGLPDQDWSLRVTQVYRRTGVAWELVHRHADPLVRPIGIDQAAALARG